MVEILCALAIMGMILLVVGISAGIGYLFMLAWNAILVPWLHAPVLNFWLAWLAFMLLSMIFGTKVTKKESD